MKKLLYILTMAATLLSCSPQKRLAYLLARHPELQSTRITHIHDTITINNTIFLPAETNTTTITLQELIAMDSVADSNGVMPSSESPTISQQTGVETDHSEAVLSAKGKGLFELQTYTKPDTIIVHDTCYIDKDIETPEFYTATEYKEKEVYKMHWWQEMFYRMGVVALICLIMFIVVYFLRR